MPSEMQKFFKSKLAMSGITFVKLIDEYNKTNDKTPVSNINNKLSRGTIKYTEVVRLADIMGYDIQWVKRDI